jgi:hypothetical protein
VDAAPNVAHDDDDDGVAVTMLFASGEGADSQWFDYKAGFYQPIIRVEWEKDVMDVILPPDTAEALIKRGYARRRGE